MVNSLIYRDSSLIKFGQHKNPRVNNPVAPNSLPGGAIEKFISTPNTSEPKTKRSIETNIYRTHCSANIRNNYQKHGIHSGTG